MIARIRKDVQVGTTPTHTWLWKGAVVRLTLDTRSKTMPFVVSEVLNWNGFGPNEATADAIMKREVRLAFDELVMMPAAGQEDGITFLRAVRSKSLSAMLVQQVEGVNDDLPYMTLFTKYGEQEICLRSTVTLDVRNYSGYDNPEKKRQVRRISFHHKLYPGLSGGASTDHVLAFLAGIKKGVSVRFAVTAWTTSPVVAEVGFVSHSLVGYLDEVPYLLSCYTGPDHTASPVQS